MIECVTTAHTSRTVVIGCCNSYQASCRFCAGADAVDLAAALLVCCIRERTAKAKTAPMASNFVDELTASEAIGALNVPDAAL